MNEPTIGIVIPTWKGIHHLPHCLPPLLASPLKPKILVIDSSSNDGTVELARKMGAETLSIPQESFNHGLTREKGRKHLDTDLVVMITQDAYATSPGMLEKLVSPLIKREASIAYGRQIPHNGANFFASFAREFNYPATSHIRSLNDRSRFGVYTFFCSNSCAAYVNQALDEVGGFPKTRFGEDTLVVAKLLMNHHQIAYVADAEVQHSHDYSLKEEFERHFDIGISRNTAKDLFKIVGKDSARGKAYAVALFNELWKKNKKLIPYALAQTAIKWAGYHLGKQASQFSNLTKKFY